MKRSTKNVIITGCFALASSAIGIISFSAGENNQINNMETKINQSGLVTINQNDSAIQILDSLLEEIKSLNKENNNLISENHTLNITIEELKKEKEEMTTLLTKKVVSLVPEIEATIFITDIRIIVKDSLDFFNIYEPTFPLTWSVNISKQREENLLDSYFISIEMCVNQDYSIRNVKAIIYQTNEDGISTIGYLPYDFNAYYSKETGEFVISGNLSNDYIGITDIIIDGYSYRESLS